VTEGDTFEELLANLEEALGACLMETDTIALYNLLPDARIVLHMEMPNPYAKAA
jgi:predicted RNase H-like HicB family nuclease